MRDFLLVLCFVLLTAVCWGIYGPVINQGRAAMQGDEPAAEASHLSSHLRTFVCVGVAYFVIAVVAPAFMLKAKGESGAWTAGGTIWSFVAGAAGAFGALGIILALGSKGQPIYVMPLVFGCAPVVNTFLTMVMARSYKQAKAPFFAGLILVAAGAAIVLVAKPKPIPKPVAESSDEKETAKPESKALTFAEQAKIGAFIALTVVCWGVYGPVLHKGQGAMRGSRLRPLICVGLAYFLVAVMIPVALMVSWGEGGGYTISGSTWSLFGGSAGAIGALGLILAFTFGGKPIYVMPLVFGAAPVINTLTTILTSKNVGEVGPLFYAGLIIVVLGATTVLIFAPKSARPKTPVESTPKPAQLPA